MKVNRGAALGEQTRQVLHACEISGGVSDCNRELPTVGSHFCMKRIIYVHGASGVDRHEGQPRQIDP